MPDSSPDEPTANSYLSEPSDARKVFAAIHDMPQTLAPPSHPDGAPAVERKALRAFAYACLRQGLIREAAVAFGQAGGIPRRAFERRGDAFARDAQYMRAVEAWEVAFLPHARRHLIEKGVWLVELLQDAAAIQAFHAVCQDATNDYGADASGATDKLVEAGCRLANRGSSEELKLASVTYLHAGTAARVQSKVLGDKLVRRDMFSEAIEMYRHAGAHDALVALGRKLRLRGLPDLAYDALCYAGDPVPTEELRDVGTALVEVGHIGAAILAFKNAGSTEQLRRLAAQLERKGDFEHAIMAWGDAEDWKRLARLADKCRRKGYIAKAIDAYAILFANGDTTAQAALTALGAELLGEDQLRFATMAYSAARKRLPRAGLLRLLDHALDGPDLALVESALRYLSILHQVTPRVQLTAFICLCVTNNLIDVAESVVLKLRDGRMLRRVGTHAIAAGRIDFARRAFLRAEFFEAARSDT